jgi:mannose-6-phosphate isomerase
VNRGGSRWAELAPSRLAPLFVPRIWGARSLAPLFELPSGSEPVGEVWMTGEQCQFASGPLAGQSLAKAWPALSAEWTGTALQGLPRIPLLVKFIFPDDKLSLQVHPDDKYASRNEAAAGGTGKTEMWYAISARPGAQVLLGFQPGVTPDSFRRAVDDGTADECLRRFPVNEGDTFFVPPGTVHTIGAGMVLCEIQQHSDLTYRVFDYGRLQPDGQPRPLHLQQAMAVLNFGEQPLGRVEPLSMRQNLLDEALLVACPYFAVAGWEFSESLARETSPDRFELLIILSGSGSIQWGPESARESVDFQPAQAWFLPAALGAYTLAPQSPTTLLHARVPNLQEYSQHLAARGITPADIAKVVHE